MPRRSWHSFSTEPINFIDNTSTSLYALIVVNIWKEFSFAMIMLMAGLQIYQAPDDRRRRLMFCPSRAQTQRRRARDLQRADKSGAGVGIAGIC